MVAFVQSLKKVNSLDQMLVTSVPMKAFERYAARISLTITTMLRAEPGRRRSLFSRVSFEDFLRPNGKSSARPQKESSFPCTSM